jgi:hypothetical protein
MGNNYAEAIDVLYKIHDADVNTLRGICHAVAAINPSAFVKAFKKTAIGDEKDVSAPNCGVISFKDYNSILTMKIR